MISLIKKFIFIHYPKTAGNAIQYNLLPYAEDEMIIKNDRMDGFHRFALGNSFVKSGKHARYSEYQDAIAPDQLKLFHKCASVRNPWDRVVSYFFYHHKFVPEKYHDFNKTNFMSCIDDCLPLEFYIGAEGYDDFDSFIRLESLQNDFNSLCDRLDIARVALDIRNASDHRHYRDYFEAETKQIVADKFAREIDFFNYRF